MCSLDSQISDNWGSSVFEKFHSSLASTLCIYDQLCNLYIILLHSCFKKQGNTACYVIRYHIFLVFKMHLYIRHPDSHSYFQGCFQGSRWLSHMYVYQKQLSCSTQQDVLFVTCIAYKNYSTTVLKEFLLLCDITSSERKNSFRH